MPALPHVQQAAVQAVPLFVYHGATCPPDVLAKQLPPPESGAEVDAAAAALVGRQLYGSETVTGIPMDSVAANALLGGALPMAKVMKGSSTAVPLPSYATSKAACSTPVMSENSCIDAPAQIADATAEVRQGEIFFAEACDAEKDALNHEVVPLGQPYDVLEDCGEAAMVTMETRRAPSRFVKRVVPPRPLSRSELRAKGVTCATAEAVERRWQDCFERLQSEGSAPVTGAFYPPCSPPACAEWVPCGSAEVACHPAASASVMLPTHYRWHPYSWTSAVVLMTDAAVYGSSSLETEYMNCPPALGEAAIAAYTHLDSAPFLPSGSSLRAPPPPPPMRALMKHVYPENGVHAVSLACRHLVHWYCGASRTVSNDPKLCPPPTGGESVIHWADRLSLWWSLHFAGKSRHRTALPRRVGADRPTWAASGHAPAIKIRSKSLAMAELTLLRSVGVHEAHLNQLAAAHDSEHRACSVEDECHEHSTAALSSPTSSAPSVSPKTHERKERSSGAAPMLMIPAAFEPSHGGLW